MSEVKREVSLVIEGGYLNLPQEFVVVSMYGLNTSLLINTSDKK